MICDVGIFPLRARRFHQFFIGRKKYTAYIRFCIVLLIVHESNIVLTQFIFRSEFSHFIYYVLVITSTEFEKKKLFGRVLFRWVSEVNKRFLNSITLWCKRPAFRDP